MKRLPNTEILLSPFLTNKCLPRLQKLSNGSKLTFVQPIYAKEIAKIILKFNPNKSSGIDGFDAHFYIFYKHFIG